jgi:superfamily I DNA/RNA helicase
MKSDYENTVVVDLKENYRSTKNILAGAGHVVAKGRKTSD